MTEIGVKAEKAKRCEEADDDDMKRVPRSVDISILTRN